MVMALMQPTSISYFQEIEMAEPEMQCIAMVMAMALMQPTLIICWMSTPAPAAEGW